MQPTTAKTFVATIALCTCSLIHAYLLISVFPYAGYMAMSLIPHLTTETAGPYAGLLASAFMAGRTLSAYPFGRMADVYGRVVVLVFSLTLSALFSLMFGMSNSFGMAMFSRFLLGLSNGIVGTVKTVVSELSTTPTCTRTSLNNTVEPNNNPSSSTQSAPSAPSRPSSSSLETRMMGMVVGMRAWGFLISPAIGGWLAEPIQQYPFLFEEDTNDDTVNLAMFFKPWLLKFPFILPNLAGAILCIGAALLVVFGVDETLPDEKRHSILNIPNDTANAVRSKLGRFFGSTTTTATTTTSSILEDMEATPLLRKLSSGKPEALARQEATTAGISTSGTCTTTGTEQRTDKHIILQDDTSAKTTTMQCLWQSHNTRQHLISYWLFSFAVVCLDESFPLFCISKQGGLGLSEGIIGQILSMAGLFFALFQYAVYVKTMDRFGLYASLWIGCGLGFFPVLFIPLSLIFNHDRLEDFSALNWPSFLFLMAIMAVSKVFCCMFFTSISIALNKTVDTTQRAALNGLATVGSSIAKGLAPIVTGALVSLTYSCVGHALGATAIIFTAVGLTGLSVMTSLVGIARY